MAEPNLFEDKSCSKSEIVGDGESNKTEQPIEDSKVTPSPSGTLHPECNPSKFGLPSDLENGPHKYDVLHVDSRVLDNANAVGATNSSSYDLELVQMNKDFSGTSDSAIELRPELKAKYAEEVRAQSSYAKAVESTDENTTLIKRLSTLFPLQKSSAQESKGSLGASSNIRMGSDYQGSNINMACAIYSENAVTKEDNLCYQGYTIRTEGADLCIHSVVFNADGNKFRIIIKTTEYDQFYDGAISRITSEPKILLDDDKWTMLYGSYDDDSLGVVEIEVPPGVSVADIKYTGPKQGFITIDVPQHTPAQSQESNDGINACLDYAS